MHFVVFPSQALSDPDTPPFLLLKQAQRPVVIITKKVLWDHLEQRLRQYDVAILVSIVRVSFRVVNPICDSREYSTAPCAREDEPASQSIPLASVRPHDLWKTSQRVDGY